MSTTKRTSTNCTSIRLHIAVGFDNCQKAFILRIVTFFRTLFNTSLRFEGIQGLLPSIGVMSRCTS